VATFFVFRIRSSCAECGEGIVIEGPTLETTCEACTAPLVIQDSYWTNILSLRADAGRFGLTEGKTRGSSLQSGEQRFLIGWGPQRPLCAGCGTVLDLASAPPGTTGDVPCACGHTTPTFPPPPWLAKADASILQLFGAPHARPAGAASPVQSNQSGVSLVSYACPDCGANLKISPETPRVTRCHYCQADSYLPDGLWRALHPVKKRPPFYVAFR
jgi:hypothetical protein